MSDRPVAAPVASGFRARLADYSVLSKFRLSLLVLAATLAGFLLGSTGPVNAPLLVGTLIGTALMAFGASALNQVMERDADARMLRTADRPLPSGRVSVDEAVLLGVACGVLGVAYLVLAVNLLTAALAASSLALYLLVYTPLKRITPLSLAVGAVPGALPPLIGFAGAADGLSYLAFLPALIVYVWQFPHFLAISWLFREDYARGGFAMLAVRDPEGSVVARQVVNRSLAMLVVSLLPAASGLCGVRYAVAALLAGLVFLALAVHMSVRRDKLTARRLFIYSIVYLPVVLTMLVVDRLGG